ncbi:hypothetical protein TRFO_30118 [Tritrichomonas foetus]|uniref:Stealth protein CR2 conserved region 2 domain-containing protein n=1 Tax=Tritrichomonas foetus TaxID=1144522 RepID=A0A1J4JUA1_9EUKA|nr:hypothetical protein TRFO_30118 [Tritrichomonas foetus]|eukprot:OHT02713.1 hypothetical protein TRFO_30118 [Tritrichomonas foetus]
MPLNSYAIEFSLCNIPGLSEHYIYMNDDMFIGKPIEKDFFFDSDGKPKIPSKKKDWGNVNSMVKSLHHHSQRNDMKGVQFSCVVHNTVQICQNYFKKTQKGEYDHTPTPITKKIMKEIYKNFPDTIHSTITSQFRNYTNVLMQLLVQLYGVGSGLATPLPVTANISKFFMVSGVSAFSGLKEDKPILFCVNTDISHFRNDVKHTLDEWMPDKSEYEL